MTLTLTPELEARIQQQVDKGGFNSPEDVIATAMDVLLDVTITESPELFHAKLEEANDEIERGETYSEVEARAYLAAMRAKL